MSESRTELLHWVNDLLKTNITKVEQCGTGAIYCQIFDAVHGDVPMNRVKFGGRLEYEHIYNYKILQAGFNTHDVDKTIPVERLIKCKYQDNLDFLQWMKKYWDTYSNGSEYDPEMRHAKVKAEAQGKKPHSRKSSVQDNSKPANRPALPVKENAHLEQQPKRIVEDENVSNKVEVPLHPANIAITSNPHSHQAYDEDSQVNHNKQQSMNVSQTQRKNVLTGNAVHLKNRIQSTNSREIVLSREQWQSDQEELRQLRAENWTLKRANEEIIIAAESLEKERNFYFGKLREIEIVVRQKIEKIQIDQAVLPLLNSIQGIMYKTEEGFESIKPKPDANARLGDFTVPPISSSRSPTTENIEIPFTQTILNAVTSKTDTRAANSPTTSPTVNNAEIVAEFSIIQNIPKAKTEETPVENTPVKVESRPLSAKIFSATESRPVSGKSDPLQRKKLNDSVMKKSGSGLSSTLQEHKSMSRTSSAKKESVKNASGLQISKEDQILPINTNPDQQKMESETDSKELQFCDAEDDQGQGVLSETPPANFTEVPFNITSDSVEEIDFEAPQNQIFVEEMIFAS